MLGSSLTHYSEEGRTALKLNGVDVYAAFSGRDGTSGSQPIIFDFWIKISSSINASQPIYTSGFGTTHTKITINKNGSDYEMKCVLTESNSVKGTVTTGDVLIGGGSENDISDRFDKWTHFQIVFAQAGGTVFGTISMNGTLVGIKSTTASYAGTLAASAAAYIGKDGVTYGNHYSIADFFVFANYTGTFMYGDIAAHRSSKGNFFSNPLHYNVTGIDKIRDGDNMARGYYKFCQHEAKGAQLNYTMDEKDKQPSLGRGMYVVNEIWHHSPGDHDTITAETVPAVHGVGTFNYGGNASNLDAWTQQTGITKSLENGVSRFTFDGTTTKDVITGFSGGLLQPTHRDAPGTQIYQMALNRFRVRCNLTGVPDGFTIHQWTGALVKNTDWEEIELVAWPGFFQNHIVTIKSNVTPTEGGGWIEVQHLGTHFLSGGVIINASAGLVNHADCDFVDFSPYDQWN
tara:strand:+ start:1030 stop:2406 length:1377 start_codon:yes stop_codon:yes gene_type:complete